MFHNRRILGAVRPPFATAAVGTDPPSIFPSNLLAWWDADTVTGYTLTDKSGNGNNLTISTTGTALLGADVDWNFQSVFKSAGGDISHVARGTLGFPSIGSAGSVFFAASVSSASSEYSRLISIGSDMAADNTGLGGLAFYVRPSITSYILDINGVTVTSATLVSSVNHVFEIAWSGTNFTLYIDNVSAGTGNAGGTINISGGSGLAISLFNIYTLAFSVPITAALPCCFVVNKAITTGERNAAHTYLATRYAI